MANKWAVIIVEQDAEDVTVHLYDEEDVACKEMHDTWKRDVATEVIESSRKVDFAKSHCLESYAELWYVMGGTPIKYFVEEVTDNAVLSDAIAKLRVTMQGKTYAIGDNIMSIEWSEKSWTTPSTTKTNVEVIAIGDGFIGIMDENGYVNEITVDKIIKIEKGE